MSQFFLTRPVFAGVCAIIIVLAGIAAFIVLPVAQYPEIAPPTIQVSANYPGANAETLSKTVAAPIEQELSGIEGLQYFNSASSANGQLSIALTFEVGTDVDAALFNVNNRVQLATPRLPDDVRRNGVLVQKRTNDLLLFAGLTSPDGSLSTLELSNYASINMVDELKRIPGVADFTLFGGRDYAMRLWLLPDKMAQLGVTVGDITAALQEQNAQYAVGRIGGEPAMSGQKLVFTVTTAGRLTDVKEFGDIVIRSGGSAGVLRIKDVARVELGGQNYDAQPYLNGKPMVGLGMFLLPGANALEVAGNVKAKLAELKKSFPPGMDYDVAVDATAFVNASIYEVVKTIAIAALLVVIVVFVFLQSWRATLIPFIAVPVSLIGTFAGLWLFNFSINTLTLFAMVLAIGIVVDDAIVVLENIERLMREQAMSAYDAAVEAMREVSGAIIAIVLVLCAVFVPVAFLGGLAGQLYRQFAVTVAIAVVISGFVALTLTPVMCAVLLQRQHIDLPFFARFNRFFTWVTTHFLNWVNAAFAHRVKAFVVFASVTTFAAGLFYFTPRGFLPNEDQGQLFASVQLPDAATMERTIAVTREIRELNKDQDAVRYMALLNGVDIIGGNNRPGVATIIMRLKPWDERDVSSDDVIAEFGKRTRGIRQAFIRAFSPPPIRGLGSAGGFEFYVQARTDADPQRLANVTLDLVKKLNEDPKLQGVNTFYRATVPQLRVDVQREKALALGLPIDQVFHALQAMMGSLYVNDFNKFGRVYRVQLQADAPYRAHPEDLGNVYVRSTTTGEMVPLKSVITVSQTVGPEQLERFNGFVAAKVLGSGKEGVSSRDAIEAAGAAARAALPPGYELAWSGQAYQELNSGSSSAFAFGAGIVMVYLILAALYERWRLPLAVVMTVPFALAGALIFIHLRGIDNDIYFQIGLVVLIGLAAKNAILIVEFAQQGFLAGMTPLQAALQAARLRFRPIVMTSLAFMLGVAPLAVSTGAGSAARHSMGTGVFGGMLASTFIATVFVPLFFTLVALRRKDRRRELPSGESA